IGDSRAAALVSKYGSIDWLCWPRFDSPSIFCSMLDRQKGGLWSIAPLEPYETTRSYLGNSNILQTEFICANGQATLTDLMPVASEAFKRCNLVASHELLRELVCTDGEIRIKVNFQPRPFYGMRSVRIRDVGKLGLRMDVDRGTYWLRSSVPLK